MTLIHSYKYATLETLVKLTNKVCNLSLIKYDFYFHIICIFFLPFFANTFASF